ncbi:acylneuraminate cytidylyltransferase family protein [Desulfocurvus sp. DL9XJH121]
MASACIIPAKGRSRRLPGKNALPVGGVPMVVRSVRGAVDSGRFDYVAVSSDDEAILALAREAGAETLRRGPELCADDVRAKDVVREHLRALGREFEYVALLMNTNPFRTANHVREAFDLMVARKVRTLVGVCAFEFCPGLAMRIEDGLLRPYRGQGMEWLREEDFPQGYRLNGAMFMGCYDHFMATGTFLDSETVPYVMDRMSSWDIDTPEDYRLAEAYLRMEQ